MRVRRLPRLRSPAPLRPPPRRSPLHRRQARSQRPGRGRQAPPCAPRRGRRAESHLSLPLHPHPGFLLSLRLPRRRPHHLARQDLQGLPDLPAPLRLRRSSDGAWPPAQDRRPRPQPHSPARTGQATNRHHPPRPLAPSRRKSHPAYQGNTGNPSGKDRLPALSLDTENPHPIHFYGIRFGPAA